MLEGDNTRVLEIPKLDETDFKMIVAFLQGAVYCWCENKKGEWFTMNDLLGDDSQFWKHTPLDALYFKYHRTLRSYFETIKKDTENILENVLDEDDRAFEKHENRYRWNDFNVKINKGGVLPPRPMPKGITSIVNVKTNNGGRILIPRPIPVGAIVLVKMKIKTDNGKLVLYTLSSQKMLERSLRKVQLSSFTRVEKEKIIVKGNTNEEQGLAEATSFLE